MRANSPIPDSFGVLNTVEDNVPAIQKLTKEDVEFAKIGKSADWKKIKKYIDSRVDKYKNELFGENLAGKDAAIIGNRFLAAQSVIQEFDALVAKVELTTKIVDSAIKETEEAEKITDV